MLDREACERRVYRLATLLTGSPASATGVISAVLTAQPDLRSLDGAHMDRLTVLRSREVKAGRIVDDRLSAASAEALAGLRRQPREAWVFRRVYEMPPREAARAMDCSVTALELHLQQADRALHDRGIDAAGLAADLLAYTMTLDVPELYRQRQRRRRRWRWALRVAAIAAAVAATALFIRWLLVW